MTKEQKLEQIRTAIDSALEANGLDSTRVLKFGCKYRNIHNSIHSFIDKAGREKHRYLITQSDNGMVDCFGEDLNIFMKEILGRDINWEDLMIAFTEKKLKVVMEAKGYFILEEPTFYGVARVKNGVRESQRIAASWKPTIPLHLQDTEVIDFIHELICKKNE